MHVIHNFKITFGLNSIADGFGGRLFQAADNFAFQNYLFYYVHDFIGNNNLFYFILYELLIRKKHVY